MKIEELISSKNDNDQINVDGLSIPVAALKMLMKDGYDFLRPYKEEKTISVWGKTCTGCFTEEELREKASSK